MQTGYSGDVRSDSDQAIHDAVAERNGRSLRIRLQPQILRAAPARGKGQGQYAVWKDVRWTVECDTAEEAFALRDALRAFFAAMGRSDPATVSAALQAVNKEAAA